MRMIQRLSLNCAEEHSGKINFLMVVMIMIIFLKNVGTAMLGHFLDTGSAGLCYKKKWSNLPFPSTVKSGHGFSYLSALSLLIWKNKDRGGIYNFFQDFSRKPSCFIFSCGIACGLWKHVFIIGTRMNNLSCLSTMWWLRFTENFQKHKK